jgi:hypothetical protein
MELEGATLREECTRLHSQVERLRAEKQASEDQRGEKELMLAALREELQTLRDIERRVKEERLASAQVGGWRCFRSLTHVLHIAHLIFEVHIV